MLPVSNDWEAVVSHEGESHHAISDLTLISQPSPVAQWLGHPPRKWKVLISSPGWVKTFQKCGMGLLAVRASAAKVEDPGFKSRLGEHFSKHVAWVDLRLGIRRKSGRSWVQVPAGSTLFKSVAWDDWRLEHLPQKWKVLGSSPSWAGAN